MSCTELCQLITTRADELESWVRWECIFLFGLLVIRVPEENEASTWSNKLCPTVEQIVVNVFLTVHLCHSDMKFGLI